MREIEVKARLKNIPDLLVKAKQLGIIFDPPISQYDSIYESTIPKSDPSWNIFRIRKQGEKTILTMKYKASTRPRDNHERETIVDNADEVAAMLNRVGYTLSVKINKNRRIAKYKDMEICIDEVDGLGSFIEIEKLASDDADVDEIQNYLWILLVKLGITPKDRVYKGYNTLMHEHLDSEE